MTEGVVHLVVRYPDQSREIRIRDILIEFSDEINRHTNAQLPKSGLIDASKLDIDITNISDKYLELLKNELHMAHLTGKEIMYFANNVGVSSKNGLEMSFTINGEIEKKAEWMVNLFKESGASDVKGKVFQGGDINEL